MDLGGKVAIVTGAASGIGAEIVRLYLEVGARVVGVDVAPDLPDARDRCSIPSRTLSAASSATATPSRGRPVMSTKGGAAPSASRGSARPPTPRAEHGPAGGKDGRRPRGRCLGRQGR